MISRLLDALYEATVANQPRKGDFREVPDSAADGNAEIPERITRPVIPTDLLNGPGKPCECGDCECASPLRDPDARPGREFHD